MITRPYDRLKEYAISNSMRYHGASIENTYYYQLPPKVTQFVRNI